MLAVCVYIHVQVHACMRIKVLIESFSRAKQGMNGTPTRLRVPILAFLDSLSTNHITRALF